jgi:hypothetical protein
MSLSNYRRQRPLCTCFDGNYVMVVSVSLNGILMQNNSRGYVSLSIEFYLAIGQIFSAAKTITQCSLWKYLFVQVQVQRY